MSPTWKSLFMWNLWTREILNQSYFVIAALSTSPWIEVFKIPLQYPHPFNSFVLCWLRLEWFHKEKESKILDLIKSLSKMRTLQRVVLQANPSDRLNHRGTSSPLSKSTNLPDLFVKFVSGLPRLVALCLFCFKIDSSKLGKIAQKLTEEILPSRPSFWFKIGSVDTKPDFSDAPQIHRYGIFERGYPPRCHPTVL